MSLATVLSRAQNGLIAELVAVEVHLAPGLPGLNIVGLPEASVREAKDRVRAAIGSSGYRFPIQRMTCNLAPADLPKDGSRFDLAIALGILLASGQLPGNCLDGYEVLGELSLSGDIRTIRGALPAALQAGRSGHRLIVPCANLDEALLARTTPVSTARHLGELCAALQSGTLAPAAAPAATPTAALAQPDLADVRGQPGARRALEIAAAGGHSLLMVGPPGSGKSMLAQRLPSLLPDLSDEEALEVAMVASISGGFDRRHWRLRPYRAPHHTASAVALVGGGSQPRPGEITLAHQGVLFLDELPEFSRSVLEVLREPLERGTITISRAARQADFPARFQLIAAMNPCPCGYLGDASTNCRCTPEQIARYRARISGPLLDRIDLRCLVPRVETQALLAGRRHQDEASAPVRARVLAARARQSQRQGTLNAMLDGDALERQCALDAPAQELMARAMQRWNLSARSYHRVLRVARTLADLDMAPSIQTPHLAEALRYREPLAA